MSGAYSGINVIGSDADRPLFISGAWWLIINVKFNKTLLDWPGKVLLFAIMCNILYARR
jgi:hypothetical protein